jgi:hypothetical protein
LYACGADRVRGGRDYQATVADDLARWRAGLAGWLNRPR